MTQKVSKSSIKLSLFKFRRLVLALVFLFAAQGVWGATRIWTGNAGDNNWNTAGNWTNNTVPGVNDTAEFDGAATVTVSSDITIGNLFILSGDNIVTLDFSGATGNNLTINTRLRLGQGPTGNLVLINAVATTKEFDTNDNGTNSLKLNDSTLTVTGKLLKNGTGTSTISADSPATGQFIVTNTVEIPDHYNNEVFEGVTIVFGEGVTVTSPITIWTGRTDSNWNDNTNWLFGLPADDTEVVIPKITPAPVLSASSAELKSITIDSEANFTLSSGGTLSVAKITNNGTITVTGGSITGTTSTPAPTFVNGDNSLVIYDGASTPAWGDTYNKLEIQSGSLVFSSDITINKDFTINSDFSNNAEITAKGNVTSTNKMSGTGKITFAGSSEQTFAGGGKQYSNVEIKNNVIITGNNEFETLTVNNGGGKTINFGATTQTITSDLTLKGTGSGNLLVLTGTAWELNCTGTSEIQYANIDHSTATSPLIAKDSVDNENNANWSFPGNTYTWISTSDTDWFTASNWDKNSVPGYGSTVIIDHTTASPVLTTRDVSLNDSPYSGTITIKPGATFVLAGRTVTAGEIINNGHIKLNGIANQITGTMSEGTETGADPTVEYTGTGATTYFVWDSDNDDSNGKQYVNLILNRTGAEVFENLEVSGELEISAATSIANTKSISANGKVSSTANVTGDGKLIFTGTQAQIFDAGGKSYSNIEKIGNSSLTINEGFNTITSFTNPSGSGNIVFNAGGTITEIVSFQTTGTVTLDGTFITKDLSFAGPVTINDNTNLSSSAAATYSANTIELAGNVTFSSASGIELSVNKITSSNQNYKLTNTGILTLSDGITVETAIENTGSLTCSNATFANDVDLSTGSFTHSGGTVELTAAKKSPATLSGSNTFNNLTINAPGKTIKFADSSEQTVSGQLNLTGSSGQLLTLTSTGETGTWSINCSTPQTLAFLSVSNSNNTTSGVVYVASSSTDGGGNTNWAFPGQTYQWMGEAEVGSKTNWQNAGNWSPASLPGSGAIITIPAGKDNYPQLSAPVDIGTGTGTITIANTASLDMNGYNFSAKTISNSGKVLLKGTETIQGAITNVNTSTVEYYGTSTITTFNWNNGQFYNLILLQPVNVSDPIQVTGTTQILADTGTVSLDNENNVFNDTVTIGKSTTSAGTVTLSGKKNGDGDAITLTDAVYATALTLKSNAQGADLTVNAPLTVNAASITTTGNQTYNDTVVLKAATTTFTAGSGKTIEFTNTVTGSVGTESLITTGGTVQFDAAVNVGTLSTQAATISSAVIITASVGDTIQFSGAITGSGSLTTVTGNSTFNGTINGLSSITTDATANFNNAVSVGALTTNTANINTATITTTGTQTYNGAITLAPGGKQTTLTASGDGSEILLKADVGSSNGSSLVTAGVLEIGNSGGSGINISVPLTVQNDVTFYSENTLTSLTATSMAGKSITFEKGKTQTFSGDLTLAGAEGNLLSLKSSDSGTAWKIKCTGTNNHSINYVDVRDSDNSQSSYYLAALTSTDSGNNINWAFPAMPYTWTGANNNTDWSDAQNWFPQSVPNAGASILIPASKPEYPIIDETVALTHTTNAGSITIENGASLGLTTDGGLTVGTITNGGTVGVSAGTLTVTTTFTNNSTVNISGGTITGTRSNGNGSIVVYNGTGDTSPIWGNDYKNLQIDNGCSVSFANDITVGNDFTNNGTASIDATKKINVAGNVTSTGNITGNGTLSFNGSDNQTFTPNGMNYPIVEVLAAGNKTISISTGLKALSFTSNRQTNLEDSIETSGNQTYKADVQINNTASLSSTGGNITFEGKVTGDSLEITKSGETVFKENVTLDSFTDNANAGIITFEKDAAITNAVTFNTDGKTVVEGTFSAPSVSFKKLEISGSVVTDTAGITVNDTTTLTGDSVFEAPVGETIHFAGTVQSDATPYKSLETKGGNVQFDAAISNINELKTAATASFGASANISTVTTIDVQAADISCSTISSSGSQTYHGDVTIQNAVALESTTGADLTFEGEVNGTSLGITKSGETLFKENVTLDSFTDNANAGIITFEKDAAITNAVTFNTNGKTVIEETFSAPSVSFKKLEISGSVVTDNAGITVNDTTTLKGDSDFETPAGQTIHFVGTVQSDATPYKSLETKGGNVQFDAAISNINELKTAETASFGTAANISTVTTIDVQAADISCSTISSSGSQTYHGDVAIQNAVALESTGENITFEGQVNGTSLEIKKSVNTKFEDDVTLGTFTDNANAGIITFKKDATITDPVTFNTNGKTVVEGTFSTPSVSFKILEISGSVVTDTTGITVNDTTAITGNAVFEAPDDQTIKFIKTVSGTSLEITKSGETLFKENVTLDSFTDNANAGIITFEKDAAITNPVTFNTDGKTVVEGTFSAPEVSFKKLEISGSVVTDNAGITVNDTTTLTGNSVFETPVGQTIHFVGTVQSDGTPYKSLETKGGNVQFDAAISKINELKTAATASFGAAADISDTTTLNVQNTQISCSSITTSGVQTYNGTVTLNSNLAIESTAETGGGITFVSTISGAQTLSITTKANSNGTSFKGNIGEAPLTPLTALSVTGPLKILSACANITTTGAQTYDGLVTITNPVAFDSSAPADITFTKKVSGDLQITKSQNTVFEAEVEIGTFKDTTNSGNLKFLKGGKITTITDGISADTFNTNGTVQFGDSTAVYPEPVMTIENNIIHRNGPTVIYGTLKTGSDKYIELAAVSGGQMKFDGKTLLYGNFLPDGDAVFTRSLTLCAAANSTFGKAGYDVIVTENLIISHGAALTIDADNTTANNIALYKGDVTLNGNLTSNNDILVLGNDYSTTPVPVLAADEYAYNSKRPGAWSQPNYTIDESFAPYNATLATKAGSTITAAKNFYANGTTLSLTGTGQWNLNVPDLTNPANGFAEAYRSSITGCNLTTDAADDTLGPKAYLVTLDCPNGGSNTNVDFGNFEIEEAYTVRDNVIYIRFNRPVRYHSTTLSKLKFNDASDDYAFTGFYKDPDCLHSLDFDTQVTELYIKAAAQNGSALGAWNTDATGTSYGATDDMSTDRAGIHHETIPCLDFPRALNDLSFIITDRWGKRLDNYSKRTTAPGTSYETVADKTGPVLYSVRTGQELHTYNSSVGADSEHSYDSHNFIEFRYSEPVDFNGDAVSNAALNADPTTAENVQVTDDFGALEGDITSSGELRIAGLGKIANGLINTGANGTTNKYVNALYRKDAYSICLSIAGYTDPVATVTDSGSHTYKKWIGYIEEAQMPRGTVTHLVDATTKQNIYVKDKSAAANPQIKYEEGTGTHNNTIPDVNSDHEGLYGPWDISEPVFAIIRQNMRTLWAPETFAPDYQAEAIGSNADGSAILDRIEFHIYDNTPEYTTTSPEWFTEVGWCEHGSSGIKSELYVDNDTYAADIFGGSRPFVTGTDAANRTTGGIRYSTIVSSAVAFKYGVGSSLPAAQVASSFDTSRPVYAGASSLIFTGASTPRRGANTLEGLYFALPLPDSVSYDVKTSFTVSFDETKAYITDLAGNRLRSKTISTVDRTPPSIDMTISPVGSDEVEIIFVKELVTDSDNIHYITDPVSLQDEPIAEAFEYLISRCLDIITIKNDGEPEEVAASDLKFDTATPAKVWITTNKNNSSFTHIKLKLSRAITLDDIQNKFIRIIHAPGYDEYSVDLFTQKPGSRVTFIQDVNGNTIQMYTAHAISDFAVSAVNPLYAYDSALTWDDGTIISQDIWYRNTTEDIDTQSWAVHDWNRDQQNFGTLPEGHTVSIVADSVASNVKIYLTNKPDDKSVSTQANKDFEFETPWRIWLPSLTADVFRVLSEKSNTNYSVATGTLISGQANRLIFDLDSDIVKQWSSGNQVSFLFGITKEDGTPVTIMHSPELDPDSSRDKYYLTSSTKMPLFALRQTAPEDFMSLDLWSFRIKDIVSQRGGVTVLNNVINSDEGEKVVIKINQPQSGKLNVLVMTLDGNIVDYLQRGESEAGEHYYSWDGSNRKGKPVARGMYFIRVTGPGLDETRKVLVVK